MKAKVFLLLTVFTCLIGNLSFAGEKSNTNVAPRSSIEITYPNKGTVWNIPQSVEILWETANIADTKSIRFFLTRDDMVVQELGSFKNTGSYTNIELAKNIGEGDKYQVVGIELFPDDKFQIAKFATPYFSIKKREAPTVERMDFAGRKISYTKELQFKNKEITVNIWDHGTQDNDIVSIYLNGLSVVTKHLLTYNKKSFTVHLDPGKKNDLFLYAHNLGKFPPNTVSIEITDGSTSENIILNSDLKSCEAVLISVAE